jgi:hypothetical protein
LKSFSVDPNNGWQNVMLSAAKHLSSALKTRFFASLRMTALGSSGYSDRLLGQMGRDHAGEKKLEENADPKRSPSVPVAMGAGQRG